MPPRVVAITPQPITRGASHSTAKGLGEDLQLSVEGRILTNAKTPAGMDEGVLTIGLTRTIEGASTVEVKTKDPENVLLHGGFFEKEAEAHIGGMAFVACSFSKHVDEYNLTFEDREFYLLSRDKKYRSATRRPGYTLAMFVRDICKHVVPHAQFVCPELHLEQPREGPPPKAPKKAKKPKFMEAPDTGTKGVSKGQIKIEGQPIDADQAKNINSILEVCEELNVSHLARLAILCAGAGESKFRTHDRNAETGADGVFQLIPSTAAGTGLSPYDTHGTAKYWFQHGYYKFGSGLSLAAQGKAPGDIAEKVEGSGAGAHYYEQYRGLAEEILRHGGAEGGSSHTSEKQKEKSHIWKVNGGENKDEENTLTGIEELAQEGGWRFFPVGNKIYFIHDHYLEKQKPAWVIDESTPGVITINWELDHKEKKRPAKVEIEARAHLWQPEPGQTVRLKASMGKFLSKGNWIVATIERKDITDNAVTITLVRPEAAKAEKSEFETISSKQKFQPVGKTGPSDPGSIQHAAGLLKEGSLAWKIYWQCWWISKQHYKYSYGGGHAKFGPSLGGAGLGLDCSGAVSWALYSAARLVQRPLATIELSGWGQHGRGQYVTIFVANTFIHEHVFMQIEIPSTISPNGEHIHATFEASHTGAIEPPPHGVGFRNNPYEEGQLKAFEKQGFIPRHWPGS